MLTTTCSGVQESKLTDFTAHKTRFLTAPIECHEINFVPLEMWTPRFLCMPAQRIQRNIPKFQDAHLGPTQKDY